MSKIKIDKDIPIPKGSTRPKNPSRRERELPFNEMEIGDSFFVPKEDLSYVRTRASRELDLFSVFQVKEEGGYRCWRVG